MQGVGGGGVVLRGAWNLLRKSAATTSAAGNGNNVRFGTGGVCALSTLQGKFDGGSVDSWMSLGGVRQKHSKRINVKVQKKVEGGVHFDGFSYFPRDPENFQDPPIEPTKLFMVKRIRSLSGCPWWEKEGIKELKLENRGSVAIIKNTPRNNAQLYKLKHLIEITPITMPYGMPDDPKNGFLKENGEFVSYNSLGDDKLLLEEAQEKVQELKKTSVDGETLKMRLRQTYYNRWN